jgi:predicted MFS family arabinose efflux permease
MEDRPDRPRTRGASGGVVTLADRRTGAAIRPGPLWRDHDFALLWSAVTASQFGFRLGQVAIPLLAVEVLAATPFDMGLLTAVQAVGMLLVGLPGGLVVDRTRRRRLLLLMDLLRAAALLSVGASATGGLLALPQLYAAALAAGAATVLFDVAQQAYLPVLVGPHRLVPANARLQASQSVAALAGPGLGGAGIAVVGSPGTMIAGGLLYLLSALALGRIRTDGAPPAESSGEKGGWSAGIGEGLRFVLRDRGLRAVACCTGTVNLFMSIVVSLLVLYLVRDLELSPGQVGLVLAAGGVGGVAAALTAVRWTRRLGQSRAICVAMLVSQPFGLLLPAAGPGWRALLGVAGWCVLGYGTTLYNIIQVSYRQASCPDRLLGRISAANRVLVWATVPLGGVLGGALGTWFGARGALWVAAVGLIGAVAWLLFSPLWRPRQPVSGSFQRLL